MPVALQGLNAADSHWEAVCDDTMPCGKPNPTDFTRIHSQLQSINICGAPIPCIPPDMPYKYLGLQQTLTLNWRHQVAGVIKLLKDKGDRLVR